MSNNTTHQASNSPPRLQQLRDLRREWKTADRKIGEALASGNTMILRSLQSSRRIWEDRMTDLANDMLADGWKPEALNS